MEGQESNIFKDIETTEHPSDETKKAVLTELEFIQNASQVMDLFVGKYIDTLVGTFTT
jgi:hypothetical protein